MRLMVITCACSLLIIIGCIYFKYRSDNIGESHSIELGISYE